MQKNMTHLKCTVNGKEQFYALEMDTNTEEAKCGLLQFLKSIFLVEEAHAAKLKAEQDQKVEKIEE